MTYDKEAYATWKRALVVGDNGASMMIPAGVPVDLIAKHGPAATAIHHGLTLQDVEFSLLYVEEDDLSAYGMCTCFNRKCTHDPCKGECGCSACNRAYHDAIDWD